MTGSPSPRRAGTRLLAGGAALLVVAAAVVALAPRAHAAGYPMVHLKPGDTITKSYPAITGQNAGPHEAGLHGAGNGYPLPENCTTATAACDTISVTFDVPADTFATHSYFFSASIAWDAGSHTADPSGQTDGKNSKDDLQTYLWPAPHGNGADGKPTSSYIARGSFGTPSPQGLVDGTLANNRLDITVENFEGINTGYTITFVFRDTSGIHFTDHSVDTGGPVDQSAVDNIPITPSAAPVVPEQVAVPFVAAVPQTPAPTAAAPDQTPLGAVRATPDPQLRGLTPGANLIALGPDNARKVSRVERAPGPTRPVGVVAVLVWLGLVPAAIVLLVLGLLARRRARTLLV